MFLNLLFYYLLSELWGGATFICDGNFFNTKIDTDYYNFVYPGIDEDVDKISGF